MHYKTYYAGHDRAYQKMRDRGQRGWSLDVEDNDAKRAWVRSVLASRPSSNILILGYGAGEFAIDAARAGAIAYGIDISATAIEIAKEDTRDLKCTFVVGDVLALPFDGDSMDIVADDHCLHCIIGGDRARFLAEAKRVLKPGGLLLIGTMCSVPDDVEIDPVTRCTIHNGVATRYFGTPEGLLTVVHRAGLTILDHRVQAACWWNCPRLDGRIIDSFSIHSRGDLICKPECG